MRLTAIPIKNGAVKTDLLGVGCFEDDKGAVVASVLGRRDRENLSKLLKEKKFTGKHGETLVFPTIAGAGSVLVLGLGKKEKFTLEKIRRAAAKILSQAKSQKSDSVVLDLESFAGKFSLSEAASAAVEGLRLSDYRFLKYKSKQTSSSSGIKECRLGSSGKEAKAVQNALKEAEIISAGVIFTRDLANEPANVMTPSRLAQAAKEMAAKNNLDCKVLGKNEMKKLGMGGLLGVSQGSAEEPKFIILENRVAKPLFDEPVVLVGKGITFDTGGISIKPANDMDKMKFDMCGAAAVIGALKTVANLKLPVRVVGLVPTCENMPGSTAQRPGDIIKIMNGKTVEVLNTDAEGRLILADALSYAERYKPKALVDIATLTGACAATFGDLASGLMGTDEDLNQRILAAGEQTGERCWTLPLWDEYFELIKATYGDIQNISKKYAGTITAGMFLKEFADHTRSWAHLDVAGTAWADAPKPLSAVGATGIGVRLFVRLIQSYV